MTSSQLLLGKNEYVQAADAVASAEVLLGDLQQADAAGGAEGRAPGGAVVGKENMRHASTGTGRSSEVYVGACNNTLRSMRWIAMCAFKATLEQRIGQGVYPIVDGATYLFCKLLSPFVLFSGHGGGGAGDSGVLRALKRLLLKRRAGLESHLRDVAHEAVQLGATIRCRKVSF